ncbi:MAG: ABC transporter ATP-binding protein [Bacteroidales bacterium]|nr:ABC transporter ATP-binding protein [Bacteroidales bacterium]
MKDFKTCVKGMWRLAKPALRRDFLTVCLGAVRIAASLSFVWICKRLVDIATGVADVSLWEHVWIMIGIVLVQIICSQASYYWEAYNITKTQNEMRQGFFSHVLGSRWNGRESFRSGDTVNRLEEDVRVLSDLVCSRFPSVVITLFQFLAAAAYLLSMAPSLLWVLLILMITAVACSKLYFKKLRQLTAVIRSEDSEVQQIIQENLQNRVLVLTLFGVGNVVSKLGNVQNLLVKNTITRLNYNAVARGFMSLGFMGGYTAAFLWGVFGIKSGTVTYGMMTAFLQLVGQVQRPVADLANQIPAFIKSLTSVERLLELEDLQLEVFKGDYMFDGTPGIRINDVTYSYPDSRRDSPVIDHFSHDFAPGSLTILAGPTGVGKSTLTRMMLGLLRPSGGSVQLYSSDGKSHVADADTRCNFTYVPQGNTLLSGTIRENLLLVNPSATEQEIVDALRLAAADFVLDLPDGLETICGEGGTGLSEGQCQRIAIARALLHPGGIMILDEATSALDLETEEHLLDNIHSSLGGSKTIVFISHRPAAIRIADDVVTL